MREEIAGEDDLCTIRRPLVLCLHGGLGCPELICNFDGSLNYSRAAPDIQAKWIGSNIAAVELFKVTQALDQRIRCCISSCYLNDRVAVNRLRPGEFYDWAWKGMILRFGDAEPVSLIRPRPCILEAATNDELFPNCRGDERIPESQGPLRKAWRWRKPGLHRVQRGAQVQPGPSASKAEIFSIEGFLISQPGTPALFRARSWSIYTKASFLRYLVAWA